MSQRLQRAAPALASRTPAETFLEALQDRVYGSLGLTAEDCQHREWLGQQLVLPERLRQKSVELSAHEFERYRDSLFDGLARDESAPRPTRFERPHQYSILRELKETIEAVVERLGHQLPARPVIGTLPTRSLEPMMLRVPGSSDVVILVDGSVLTYANLLAKAVAQALPPDVAVSDGVTPGPGGPADGHPIDATGSARSRFLELMLATIDGRPAGAPPYLPEARYEHVAADLCDFMELFVIAREYARLIEGDHEGGRTRRRTVNGQSFDVLAWTEEQELKADGLALVLVLAAAHDQGGSLAWAFWSVDVLLASFAVLERTAWLMRGAAGQALVTPMPNAHDRRRQALRALLARCQGGEQAVAFADGLQPIVDTLESALEARLYEHHGDVAVH